MAEKLSITIFLDGAAEIERQLEGIGQAGTKAFEEIGKAAEQVGGFDKLDPKDVTKKLEQFGVKGKAAIDKITTAVAQAGRLERIVGGVRAVEAGFASIGTAASAMSTRVTNAFTAIATAAASTGGAVGRVARSLGLLGGGAIVGSLGAAALAMEKAADSARVLQGNLQALFRNAQAGTQFFNQIQNAAQTAGASLQGTAKTMLDITNAFRAASQARGVRFAPGEELKQASKDAAQLFEILQQGMKLSGARAEEANKAISALFNEISKSGQVSGDTLRKLQAQFPQLGNALAKALGAPGQSLDQLADRIDKGLAKIDFQKFTRAIKSIGPEMQTLSNAFDPTLAQRMDTIAGAWNRLLNSFAASPTGAVIKGVLDDIAKGLDEVAKKQEQVGKFTVEKPPETTTGKLLEQVFQEFNQNIEIAKQNWKRLVDFINTPIQAGADLWQWLLDSFDSIVEKIKTKAQELANFLKNILTQKPEVGGQLSDMGTLTPQRFTGPQGAGGELLPDSPESLNIEDRRADLESMRAAAQEVFAEIQRIGTEAFAAIVAAATEAASNIATALGQLGQAITSGLNISGAQAAFSALEISVIATMQNIAVSIQQATQALQQFISAASAVSGSVPGGAAAGGQFARGGLLRGRGTGTSDSNLAWVSRGEYIVPARVVRQPGVLALLEALRGAGRNRLKNGLPAFQEGGEVGGAAIARAVSSAIDRIVQLLDQAAATGFESTVRLIQRLNDLSVGIQTGATQTVNQIAQQAQALINTVNQGTGSFTNAIVQMGELIKQNSNQMVESFKAAAVALRQLQSSLGGAASGGLLGGRGTGTSDSNLVRVSRGEYIIPARAVRQPGVLAFLEALRRSGGSLRDVLDDMGRFALGGLVPRQIPAFASSGLAGGGMSNVTIQFPGLQPIEGLRASETVIDELRKAAALAQVRSGGRKPSRYT